MAAERPGGDRRECVVALADSEGSFEECGVGEDTEGSVRR
jgi:hypothetical protein